MKRKFGNRHRIGVSWALALALGLLVSASDARAQSQADIERAREQFRLGNEAYQAQQWQQAIQYFQAANEIAPNDRLSLYIGQCYLAMDDPARALEFVRRYSNSSPEAYAEVVELLNALEQTGDLAIERAQRAVDHAWRLARGSDSAEIASRPVSDIRVVPIQIRSQPSGAEVFVDDETLGPVGRTPLDTQLFVGVHHIIVRQAHHEPFVQRINVTPLSGGPVPIITATLQRAAGNVDIRVNPVTARVTFIANDGQTFDLGQGGYRGSLPAGEGVFLIQHAGQERRLEQVIEGTGETERFTLNLNPRDDVVETEVRMGTLIVRSNLAFATITVDGAPLGEGIGQFETSLRPGPHTIRVSQEGYETVIDSVTVAADERQTWSAPTRLVGVSSIPWGGIITGALGVGAIVTGAVFGVSASGSADDFNACQRDPACGFDEGDGYRGDAQTSALIADICFGVGAALAVTSLVLFLTSGPEHGAAASIDRPYRFAAGPADGGWGVVFSFDDRLFAPDSW